MRPPAGCRTVLQICQGARKVVRKTARPSIQTGNERTVL
ncbi:hypothetical protein FMZ60_02630 [Alcaligenaceae bacterium SJ-26]|uniref:Uncharacterized protein n=1 Tax=Corticimicrobacter populi TaxID=2175229 RepID=A0A2V1JYJ8_9BURK|nr:hypothetical protein DD235_11605 [Corticimicrobacter populi]QDQ86607.1 hypothetical protein FMZ60_02630 [Alcaligenaceae bacterium SJ-26]